MAALKQSPQPWPSASPLLSSACGLASLDQAGTNEYAEYCSVFISGTYANAFLSMVSTLPSFPCVSIRTIVLGTVVQ